jgi:hypothetical protein
MPKRVRDRRVLRNEQQGPQQGKQDGTKVSHGDVEVLKKAR